MSLELLISVLFVMLGIGLLIFSKRISFFLYKYFTDLSHENPESRTVRGYFIGIMAIIVGVFGILKYFELI